MAPSPFTNGTTNGRGEFAQHLQRHQPYYINGGDIHFLVENYVFRVHRYFFERESAYFRDKLSYPATPGRPQQGTEDANAIVLDVRAQDFEKLMWVFYNPKYSIYDANVSTWATILQLAHRWWFPEVKALCVRELEQKEMTPIDRIVLYQKYEVDENLLVSRFAAVCAREEPISVDEGQMLGIKTAMRLTQARERLRSSDGSKSPLPPHRNDKDVHDIVVSLFEITTPESLQTPITAAATEAAASQPQAQSGQPASATTPATTESTQTTAASTGPATTTTTPASTATTAMNSTPATEPVKGPTPKSSLMGIKSNTKAEHKTTPSTSAPTPDAKPTTETPTKTNETQDSSQASMKGTPGSRNGSTTDLVSNVTSPNVKSPGGGSPFSNLFSSKGHKESDSIDGTGDAAGGEGENDTSTGGRTKNRNRRKGLF